MKLKAIVLLFLASICHATCDSTLTPTYTTNMGLSKPAINSCSWGTVTNANWDILDTSAAIQGKTNIFTSTNTFAQPIIITSTAPLRFSDTSTHYIQFFASPTVTTTNFTFPSGDGSSGQFMKTDGSGNLSFGTAPGAASTLAVQKNAVNVSSPTVAINVLSPPFTASLVNGSTTQMSLDASSATLQGNTFNQASKLVQLDSSARLPTVDGSQLTNLTFSANISSITVSTLTVTSSTTFRGPVSFSSGPFSNWVSYSPTISAGFGTTTNAGCFWRRIGDSIEIQCYFQAGTVAGSVASVSMPTPLAIDTSKVASTASATALGTWWDDAGSFGTGNFSGVVFSDLSATNTLFFASAGNTTTAFSKANVSSLIGGGQGFSFRATVPILGWSF